jgi:hypothetical protein
VKSDKVVTANNARANGLTNRANNEKNPLPNMPEHQCADDLDRIIQLSEQLKASFVRWGVT